MVDGVALRRRAARVLQRRRDRGHKRPAEFLVLVVPNAPHLIKGPFKPLLACTALALAERISSLDRQLVHYRVTNRASLQSTNDKSPLCFAHAFESLWISLCRRGVSDLFEGAFSCHFVDAIVANSNSMRTISGLRKIVDYTKAQIEPRFSLSEKVEAAGCDSSLLEQYRTLVFSQLEDYLLFSRRMAQYALDDQAWCLDWLEWAS